MTISQQLKKKHQMKVLNSWQIPSKDKKNKGVYYTVEELESGDFVCDCPSYKQCKHIGTVKEFFI